MNRREFLSEFFRRRVRPILLIAVVIYAVLFLVEVFRENGAERLTTIILLVFATVVILIDLLVCFIRNATTRVYERLSEKWKARLFVMDQILAFAIPIVYAYTFYYLWQRDWMYASIIVAVLIVERLAKLFTPERIDDEDLLDN